MNTLLISGNLTRSSGQSLVNEQVIKCIAGGNQSGKTYVARGYGRNFRGQIGLVLKVAYRCLFSDVNAIYYAPSRSIRGILRDIVLYLFSGCSSKHLVVHWHGSDLGVYSQNSVVVSLARNYLERATHICLTNGQKDLVSSIWPTAEKLVLANIPAPGFLDELEDVICTLSNSRKHGRKVVVSILSSLKMTKGVRQFCQIAQRFSGDDFEFRLYGEPAGDEEGAISDVEGVLRTYQRDIHYHGAVYGRDKIKALLETDVFLFPSRYASEAVPLSVLEALIAGCYVISTNVGFVSEFGNWPNLELVNATTSTQISGWEELIRGHRRVAIDVTERRSFIKNAIKETRALEIQFESTVRSVILGREGANGG